MMKELQIFNKDGFEVRALEQDGEPWFVAKDIAEALGYAWQPNLVSHVPEEWRGIKPINTHGGMQNMLCLSEQGLYFFLGRSDKPLALPFQKWIAGEVLPSIRKTGAYFAMPKTYIEALESLVKSEKEKQELQTKNLEMLPKAEFFDQVADSKDALQMRDVAGVLNVPGYGRNTLFEFLRKQGVLDSRNIPYRKYQDQGYFRVIEQKWTDGEGETHISLKTLVYQRGVDYIRKLVQEAA
jgi:prophage antirepressor-like protein